MVARFVLGSCLAPTAQTVKLPDGQVCGKHGGPISTSFARTKIFRTRPQRLSDFTVTNFRFSFLSGSMDWTAMDGCSQSMSTSVSESEDVWPLVPIFGRSCGDLWRKRAKRS